MSIVCELDELGVGGPQLRVARDGGVVAFELFGDVAEAIFDDGTRLVLTLEETPAEVLRRGVERGRGGRAARG
jgi:hypothetical protein